MGRKQACAFIAALISAPLAAQDYNPTLIPPQIIGSIPTMTPANLGDDGTRRVQFGFPFEYYGQTFTSAWVSSNGFVSFYGPDDLCCDGRPMAQAQRNTIYAYWTDLVGGSNPYYRMTDTSAIFGWYGTKEYGTNNSNTFEIGLFDDGKIQINYGLVSNSGHTVAAGLTGPTSADNVQLFYGTNVSNLSLQSGILVPNAPEPTLSPISVAPIVIPSLELNPLSITIPNQEAQTEAAAAAAEEMMQAAEEAGVDLTSPEVETLVEAAAEEMQATAEEENTPEDANDPPPPPGMMPGPAPAPESTIVVSSSKRDRNVSFFQSEAIEDADTFARETVLKPGVDNIAFMAQADAQYDQQFGAQTTTRTEGVTYGIDPVDGPMFLPPPTTGMVDTATAGKVETTTPSGQAQQMEVLNMGGMQNEMASGEPTDVGDVVGGDGETMAQLGAVPAGYGAYTQARIPDMPFYQPRDIYKNRRIPDANMALYRIMSGQDARWQEMVDDQYE
jgi:hypothetical protein